MVVVMVGVLREVVRGAGGGYLPLPVDTNIDPQGEEVKGLGD